MLSQLTIFHVIEKLLLKLRPSAIYDMAWLVVRYQILQNPILSLLVSDLGPSCNNFFCCWYGICDLNTFI